MPLAHLPAELICQIAESLLPHERLNLRLACRHVEHAIFRLFKAQSCEVGFMITTRSLEILRGISMHPELADVVEHVWFNPDCFTHVDARSCDDVGQSAEPARWSETFQEPERVPRTTILTEFLYAWDRHDYGPPPSQYYISGDQFVAFKSCLRDYTELLSDLTLKEHISLALQRFRKLRVLGMRRGMRHRPFGLTSSAKAIDLDPRVVSKWPLKREVDKFLSPPTCFFAHLMLAISEHTIKLERLYTDGVQIDQISMGDILSAPSRSLLDHLRALELNIVQSRETTTDRDKYGEEVDRHYPPESCDPFEHSVAVVPVANDFGGLGEGIIQVLGAAPQVQDLTFTMWPNNHFKTARGREIAHDEAGHRIETVYNWAAFSQVVKAALFTNLTRLKLGSIWTTAGLLNKFLSSSASTLRDLQLAHIRLLLSLDDHDWSRQPRAPWRIVFSTLAKYFPSLSYIHFRCIDVHLPSCYVTYDADPENDDERGWDDEESDQDFLRKQRNSKPISPSFMLEARGVADVHHRLRVITKKHWYAKPELHEVEQDEREPLWPANDDER